MTDPYRQNGRLGMGFGAIVCALLTASCGSSDGGGKDGGNQHREDGSPPPATDAALADGSRPMPTADSGPEPLDGPPAPTPDTSLPANCTQAPCPGDYYCDLASGVCQPGCVDDEGCGTHESCDLASHSCVCAAGTHRCGTSCLSSSSPSSCGSSCSPCPTVAHGAATCDGTSCGLACNPGYEFCNGSCAACPSGPGVSQTACQGSACVVTGCAAGYYTCAAGCCAWSKEKIADLDMAPYDSTNQVIDLALDAYGNPHVAFEEGAVSGSAAMAQIRYGYHDGSSWSVSDLALGSGFPAIALTAGGSPRIGWMNLSGGLTYSYPSSGTWQQVHIGGGDRHLSLGVNSYDAVKAVYVDSSAQKLYYASQSGYSWDHSEVASANYHARTALVIDSSGYAHLVYGQADKVYYARQVYGGSWNIELVGAASTTNATVRVDLALDSQKRPAVIYHSTKTSDYRILVFDGQQWGSWLTPPSTLGGGNVGIGFGPGDELIAMTGKSPAVHWYDGSSWRSSSLDVGDADAAFAVDPQGQPLVAYRKGLEVYLAR